MNLTAIYVGKCKQKINISCLDQNFSDMGLSHDIIAEINACFF